MRIVKTEIGSYESLPRVVDGLNEDEREGSGATSRDNILAELLAVACLLAHLKSEVIEI